ncbi:hypothetical protein [Parvularcula sp. IMCC14364]|uniref:glycine-rich domain-containing protein n=1 Tax=Parvularcula sp. IMCC14364 TaxID=3067902 RepID=UPI002742946E|nr:hypothetical protein [Parvularcula sp. IMCC14364]
MQTNPELWKTLSALPFEQNAVPFGFAGRLARDNGWSGDFAERVINEYRKFAYLAMVAGHEVTPSDEVDQVWHLHMTYTRHYWGPFQDALGRPLHHGPTQGTSSDKARFDDNYAHTLASYEREFGDVPPADIWPDATIRFGDAPFYQRVNKATHLVLPVPRAVRQLLSARNRLALGLLSVLGLSGLTFASAQAALQGENSGGWPLFVWLLLGAGAFLILFGVISGINSAKSAAAKKSGSGCGAGYVSGGSGRSRMDKDADGDADGGGDGGSGCSGGGCGGGGCGG